jgi:hypothetical protein
MLGNNIKSLVEMKKEHIKIYFSVYNFFKKKKYD